MRDFMDLFSLKGKKAIVTGGTRGLGWVLEAVVQLLLYYQHLPRHNVPVQLFLYRYYVV